MFSFLQLLPNYHHRFPKRNLNSAHLLVAIVFAFFAEVPLPNCLLNLISVFYSIRQLRVSITILAAQLH